MWNWIGTTAHMLLSPLIKLCVQYTVRTRVLVIAEGKVLVLKQWLGTNKWSLPGGGLKRGEAPVAGALRELHEETGITVEADKLQFMFQRQQDSKAGDYFPYHCFLLELSKQPTVHYRRGELVAAAWVDVASLTTKTASGDTLTAVTAWTASS